MQCVEFESRLNCILDDREWPLHDPLLVEHAQDCPVCSELLVAHEALLEGVQAMPAVALEEPDRLALARRVAMEVGSGPLAPFPSEHTVELARPLQNVVAKKSLGSVAVVAILIASAAALLIAFSPWFVAPRHLNAPQPANRSIADNEPATALERLALKASNYQDLAPIARVGYEVADGLTPVTNSMVSALRELRKRPFFRTSDESRRSSYYLPRTEFEAIV